MLDANELDKKLDLLIEGESLDDGDSALSTAKAIAELPLLDIEGNRRDTIKNKFLAQAAKKQTPRIKPARSWRILSGRRIAAAALAVFMSSGATVYAASGSMPDSTLYPIKRAAEDTALFVAPDGLKSTMKTKLARERKKEIRYMLAKEKPTETRSDIQKPVRDALDTGRNPGKHETPKKKTEHRNQIRQRDKKDNQGKNNKNILRNKERKPAKNRGQNPNL